MGETLNDETLKQLKIGDRITYHGVRWQVCDSSTYLDPKGYSMAEWQIKSTTGKEYYLLREMDPAHPEGSVRWYLAEALTYPKLIDPDTQNDVLTTVPERMKLNQTPYPTLQLFNRTYQFESQTEGNCASDSGVQHRITWDYWDEPHLWNLALELWESGELNAFSTREVQPEDFSEHRTPDAISWLGKSASRFSPSIDEIPKFGTAASEGSAWPANPPQQSWGWSRNSQLWFAWGLTILGFFLMLVGI